MELEFPAVIGSMGAGRELPGTIGWSGIPSRNRSRWNLKVSTVQLVMSLMSDGRELKRVGPETWKEEALSLLSLLLFPPIAPGILQSLPVEGLYEAWIPQEGTKDSRFFQVRMILYHLILLCMEEIPIDASLSQ